MKSLTTGLKSMASSPLSIAARCARPLARSCSVSVLVMSVIERFLVFADPNGPVTKAPGHEGPHKESNDSHQGMGATPKGFSNGRDSHFGWRGWCLDPKCKVTGALSTINLLGNCLDALFWSAFDRERAVTRA